MSFSWYVLWYTVHSVVYMCDLILARIWLLGLCPFVNRVLQTGHKDRSDQFQLGTSRLDGFCSRDSQTHWCRVKGKQTWNIKYNTRFIKGHKSSNHIRARIKSHVYTTEWTVYHSTYHVKRYNKANTNVIYYNNDINVWYSGSVVQNTNKALRSWSRAPQGRDAGGAGLGRARFGPAGRGRGGGVGALAGQDLGLAGFWVLVCWAAWWVWAGF